jgi:hypothetical protein
MGHSRRTIVDEAPDPLPSKEYVSIVINHPLWVEDFIGDYQQRTTMR